MGRKKRNKEYHVPLINARLKNEVLTNECQCDGCVEGDSNECNMEYHGQSIHVIEATTDGITWAYFDDVNWSHPAV